MMSKLFFKVFSIVLVCGLMVAPAVSQARDVDFRLIYVTDLPNIVTKKGVGGLSELATLLKEKMAADQEVFFLHGGDSLGPSALSSLDRGSHMVDVINSLAPTAMAVAQREFSYYEDELTVRASEASFPLVSANIIDPLTGGGLEGLLPWHIVDAGEVKVGITSIISPEVLPNYLPKRIKLIPADQAVKAAVSQMRDEGADIIVLMADYLPQEQDTWLQDGLVDILLTNLDGKENTFRHVNQRLDAGMGRNDGIAIEVEVTLNEQGGVPATFEGRSVPLNGFAPDADVKALIDGYLSTLDELLNTEIGTFGVSVNTERRLVRTQESGFGNLVADALREYLNADVGFFNGGSIRGKRIYQKGAVITRGTIQSELPFRNTAILLELNGQQIWDALENGFSLIEKEKGRFPQVSGIRVRINPKAPVGQRVLSAEIDGKPIDPDARYRVATTSFLAGGGDGYASLKSGKKLHETVGEQILSDIVTNYIIEHKTVMPQVENRIVQVEQ